MFFVMECFDVCMTADHAVIIYTAIDVPIFDCKHNIQDHQGYIFMRQGKFQCISFYKNAALCLSAQCLLLWTVDQSFGGSKVAFIGHKFQI